MNLKTTLNIIRAHHPCAEGWKKLLKHLNKNEADDEIINFATILESNGPADALWALRAVLPEQEKDRDRAARLFACDCAEMVLPAFEMVFPKDNRPRHTIEVARDFANGLATQKELSAAAYAARDAAYAAPDAAINQTELFIRNFCAEDKA